jgi:hypothetical protein
MPSEEKETEEAELRRRQRRETERAQQKEEETNRRADESLDEYLLRIGVKPEALEGVKNQIKVERRKREELDDAKSHDFRRAEAPQFIGGRKEGTDTFSRGTVAYILRRRC